MADIKISAEELVGQSEAIRASLAKTARPIAVLAHNGMTALLARQLANECEVPLVPINPLLTAPEITHIVGDSQCGELIAEGQLGDVAESALSLLAAPPRLHLSTAAPLSEEDCLHLEGSGLRDFGEKEIGATIIYTSGTTGKPKGCVRTAAQEFARAKELVQSYKLSAQDIQLVPCPLAHSAPGIFVRAAHAVGATSVILRRFRALSFWEHCQGVGASFFFLVPTQYRRLLDAAATSEVPDTLRCAIVAGAPLYRALHHELIQWLGGNRLWQFYGSSETGTVAIAAPSDTPSSSVGRLAPHVELQIRRDNGQLCERDEVGEMFVRSPTVMSGYQGHPSSHQGDGFVSVGDLGYQDAGGNLFLVDRKHDTIISGGVNVYPAEVEAALLSHTQVHSAVVVGMEDEDWGQRVVALVAAEEACTEESLRLHCDGLLARYKWPKQVVFIAIEDMPIGASGKPLRRSARAMLL